MAITETLTGQPPVPRQKINRSCLTPLKTGLDTKNGRSIGHGPVVFSSCNLYIGSDFVVRVPDWLAMSTMIADDTSGGIMHCDFWLNGSITELQFSVGGYRLLTLPNAGGSSELSEALSFEVLQRCFRASLVKTEMEVQYFPKGGAMTDYMCSLGGHDVAVSVTRAMKFKGDFTEEDGLHLLNKKLKGVVQSNHNALDKWSKQILHVWATSAAVAKTLTSVYHNLVNPKIKSNTVVLVTTTCKSTLIFENG